jgi:hypothetical protein
MAGAETPITIVAGVGHVSSFCTPITPHVLLNYPLYIKLIIHYHSPVESGPLALVEDTGEQMWEHVTFHEKNSTYSLNGRDECILKVESGDDI